MGPTLAGKRHAFQTNAFTIEAADGIAAQKARPMRKHKLLAAFGFKQSHITQVLGKDTEWTPTFNRLAETAPVHTWAPIMTARSRNRTSNQRHFRTAPTRNERAMQRTRTPFHQQQGPACTHRNRRITHPENQTMRKQRPSLQSNTTIYQPMDSITSSHCRNMDQSNRTRPKPATATDPSDERENDAAKRQTHWTMNHPRRKNPLPTGTTEGNPHQTASMTKQFLSH
jgi:hypothetical protein